MSDQLQGGICQEIGKENVPDTPQPKHPRMPKPKKASTVVVVLSRCVGADRSRLPISHYPNTELCGLWVVQVVVPQLQQSHAAEAADNVEVLHCTQIPFAKESTGLKRPRKQGQLKELAEAGETTPQPRRRSKAKSLLTAEGGQAALTLQTPMPVSEAGSEFGPPPEPQGMHLCSNTTWSSNS